MTTKMRAEILDLILAYERLIVLAHSKEVTLTHAERVIIAYYAQELEQEILPSRVIQYELSA